MLVLVEIIYGVVWRQVQDLGIIDIGIVVIYIGKQMVGLYMLEFLKVSIGIKCIEVEVKQEFIEAFIFIQGIVCFIVFDV